MRFSIACISGMSTVMSGDSLGTNIWRRRSPRRPLPRALGAVDRFDGRGDVRAWLFTIARNVWVDHCRRHRRETELPGEDLPGGGDFAGALEDREEVLALHRILHTLPEPYKEVFGPAGVRGAALPGHRTGLRKDGGLGPCDLLPAKSRILRQWEAERDESEL